MRERRERDKEDGKEWRIGSCRMKTENGHAHVWCTWRGKSVHSRFRALLYRTIRKYLSIWFFNEGMREFAVISQWSISKHRNFKHSAFSQWLLHAFLLQDDLPNDLYNRIDIHFTMISHFPNLYNNFLFPYSHHLEILALSPLAPCYNNPT